VVVVENDSGTAQIGDVRLSLSIRFWTAVSEVVEQPRAQVSLLIPSNGELQQPIDRSYIPNGRSFCFTGLA
jgi:hypothetical protein